MKTVEYTKSTDPGSSLVDMIYYNENTKQLTVDLDDSIYRYSNVPVDEFATFRDAASAGRHYNTYIKRTYGPGEFVGLWDEIDFVSVAKVVEMPVSPVRANGPDRPVTGFYDHGSVAVPKGEIGVTSYNHQAAPVASHHSITPNVDAWNGTGKNLVTTPNTVITNTANSLTAPESKIRNHLVTFESDGREMSHNVKAESVDEAVEAINAIADMLDLTFVVKTVLVHVG